MPPPRKQTPPQPLFKPQPKVMQTKTVAPPVYRPQALPKCLQRKTAVTTTTPLANKPPRTPTPPPVYKPQATPKVLQAKSRATPPVYRPQPTPKVLQRKQVNGPTTRQFSAQGSRPAGFLGGKSVIQRMKILQDHGDHQIVEFSPGEQQPDDKGLLNGDGYFYQRRGSGIYQRRPRLGYQREAAESSSSSQKDSSGRPGYVSGQAPLGGGPVTVNESKYFKQQGAIDRYYYDLRPEEEDGEDEPSQPDEEAKVAKVGYSRLIGADDLEDDMIQNIVGLEKKFKGVSGLLGSGVERVAGGIPLSEGMKQRASLLPDHIDPRVVHYLAIHTLPGYASKAGSVGLSLVTGGVSSMAENLEAAVEGIGLGAELAKLARDLAEENRQGIAQSHNASEAAPYRKAKSLVDALLTLAGHVGGASVVSGAKAIPVIGMAVSALDKGKRLVVGLSGEVKEACRVIHRFAQREHPYALQVAKLLGIPEEVMAAEGGTRVMESRL